MQKLEKITPSRSSAPNSPVMAPSAFCARRSSSASRSSAGPLLELRGGLHQMRIDGAQRPV